MIASSDNKITFFSKLDNEITPDARKHIEKLTCGQLKLTSYNEQNKKQEC